MSNASMTHALSTRIGALHQRDLQQQADRARLASQTRPSSRPPSRQKPSTQTLIAVHSLVQSLLLSPRAARLAAVVIVLVSAALLGPMPSL
jgi:hypothetical protein